MCPYTCPLLQQTHTFTNGLGSTRKRGTLQDHAYQTTRVYPNEVENHVMNLSLSKYVKKVGSNWQMSFTKVEYQKCTCMWTSRILVNVKQIERIND